MPQKETIAAISEPEADTAVQWQKRYVIAEHEHLTIGSSEDCSITLNDPSASRVHARLRRAGTVWTLSDERTTNGTFVNGKRLQQPQALRIQDRFVIGTTIFELQLAHLRKGVPLATHVRARQLTKQVRHRASEDTGDGSATRNLLEKIDLDIGPGEFVAILGGSGSGKSTLLSALAGRDVNCSGHITYDGQPLKEIAEEFRPRVGFVPQTTIVHDGLSVSEALYFSGRLSLANNDKSIVASRIEGALKRSSFESHQGERTNKVSMLSGGQRKRVCLAMELLRDLKLLFLDEVTSGLDVKTERDVMGELRELADLGTTIVCVTHHLHSLDRCHRIVFLDEGKLVFSLPVAKVAEELRNHGSTEYATLFTNRALRSSLAAESRKQAAHAAGAGWPIAAEAAGKGATQPKVTVRSHIRVLWRRIATALRQIWWLTRRHFALLRSDGLVTLFLAAVAPAIVTRVLCVLTNSMPTAKESPPLSGAEDAAQWLAFIRQQQMLAFGAVLTVIFLGLFATVQVIVKEQEIYKHEYFRGIGPFPYVLSNLVPMGLLGLLQALTVTSVINLSGTMVGVAFQDQLRVLGTTSLVAVVGGLALSAWIPERTREAQIDGGTLALMLMNVLVIPQILFTSAFVSLKSVAAALADACVSANWSYQAFDALIRAMVSKRAPGVLHELGTLLPRKGDAPPTLTLSMSVLRWHLAVALCLLIVGMWRKGRKSYATRRAVPGTVGPAIYGTRGRSTVGVAAIALIALGAMALAPWERIWKEHTVDPIPNSADLKAMRECPRETILDPESTGDSEATRAGRRNPGAARGKPPARKAAPAPSR